jgi:hypothetical protein
MVDAGILTAKLTAELYRSLDSGQTWQQVPIDAESVCEGALYRLKAFLDKKVIFDRELNLSVPPDA